jgi:uncharacterized cofD-like protein
VLPNLLVEDIARAVKTSNATKVYVCNVATERGETDEFTVSDHITALKSHVGDNIFHYVLANNNHNVRIAPELRSNPVPVNGSLVDLEEYNVVVADVIDPASPMRHDSKRLAQSIMRIYYDGTQAATSKTSKPKEKPELVTV